MTAELAWEGIVDFQEPAVVGCTAGVAWIEGVHLEPVGSAVEVAVAAWP